MSPEPLFGILSSGADLIRRKLIGNPEPSATISRQQQQQQQHNKQQKIMLSRLEKRALRSLKLLEKVENVGLENIIATQPSAVSQLASGIASRSASPMAQLTSLKNLHSINQATSSYTENLDNAQFYHNRRLNINSDSDFIRKNLGSDLSDDSGTSSLSSLNSNISSSNSNEHQQQQQSAQIENASSSTTQNINREIDTTTADIRIRQMQRQKSRRGLKNGIGGQRPDLGTVGGRIRPDLGVVKNSSPDKSSLQKTATTTTTSDQSLASSSEKTITQSMTQSFVGSISSLFFGRKGGWL